MVSSSASLRVDSPGQVLHNQYLWVLLISTTLISALLLLITTSTASAVSPQFVGLMWNGQHQILESESDWDAIQHSGTKLFRVQGFWKLVNDKGNWKEDPAWQQTYDKYFQLAAEREITMLPYLYGRKTGIVEKQFYLKTEWNEWLQFVWTFVQRYGRGGNFWAAHPSLPYKPVTVWEVWNEPNLAENNPGGTVLPQKYAEFLVATSKTITEAQSAIRKTGEPFDTKILVGGLYEEWGVTPWSVEKFVMKISTDPVLNNEFKSRNSGYGLHPYSFTGDEKAKIDGVKNNVNLARTALTNYDSSLKPIWITELGWPVPGAAQHAVSTLQEQASLLTKSFNWLKEQSGPKNIEYVAWYNYRDAGLGGAPWDQLCGLGDINGVYRPAWFAFQSQAGAFFWPSQWEAENIGGTSASDPAISSWGKDRLDVFVRGGNNELWHRFWNGSGWSEWESLGGTLSSGPGAVSWGPDRIDVFTRGGENALWHRFWNGSGWSEWESLGGLLASEPAVSSWGKDRLDVFVRGGDNALWHRFWNGSGWSEWESLGGTLSAAPAAVSWGPNRIDVFVRGGDNALWHRFWNGSGWSEWESLGGLLASRPAISSWGKDRLDVFVRGGNNELWHRFWNGSGWSEWESLGGALSSGPGAVSWGPNRIDVVARAEDNSVNHLAWPEP